METKHSSSAIREHYKSLKNYGIKVYINYFGFMDWFYNFDDVKCCQSNSAKCSEYQDTNATNLSLVHRQFYQLKFILFFVCRVHDVYIYLHEFMMSSLLRYSPVLTV